MRQTLYLPLFLLLFLIPKTHLMGLTIEVSGGAGSDLPAFEHRSTSSIPLSIAVQLHNESSVATENVLLWQIGLEIVGVNGATGDVEITELIAAAPSFLNSPGPAAIPPNTLPNNSAIFADVDMTPPPSFPGSDILPGETRDLFTIELASSNQAKGTFYLVMGDFDPIAGSAWSGMSPPPKAFANTLGTTLPDEIVLAEIEFLVPEPNCVNLLVFAVFVQALSRNNRLKFAEIAKTRATRY